MMAMSNKVPNQEPGEIEALLPWHAAGTLNARDTRRVDEALAKDPDLARQYAAIQEEFAETISLNESLGAPSSRAMQKLFAAIDAEPARSGTRSFGLAARISGFFASLSPRTLAASAAVAVLAILLQAGVIGTVLMKRDSGSFQTASYEAAPSSAPTTITRSLAPAEAATTRLFVRFAATARVSDITALLDSYQGTIVDSGKDGLFQLQFGNRPMTKDQVAGLIRRLESEKIVSMAVQAQ
jgi:anti-sigma-K factor RskA